MSGCNLQTHQLSRQRQKEAPLASTVNSGYSCRVSKLHVDFLGILHLYIYIYWLYLALFLSLHIHIYTYTYIHIHIYIYIYTHIYIYIHVHIHIHVHIRIYIYMYMYIWLGGIIPIQSILLAIPKRSLKIVLLHVIDVDLHGLPQGYAGLYVILRASTTLEVNAWEI